MIVKFFQTPFSLAKVAEKQGELKKKMNISRTIVPLRAFFVKQKKRADIAFLGETFVVCKKQEYLFFFTIFSISSIYYWKV